MEINFENHYERITVQIETLLSFKDPFPGILESSLEVYSVRLFSEDWLKNKGYDWGEYISTLLDKATDCLLQFEEFVSKNKELEDEFCSSSLDDTSENAKLIYMYNLASKFNPQLKNFILEIQSCCDFFEKNKELPPYSVRLEKGERIPFWGNSREFTLFFNLILNSSLVLAKNQNREPLYFPEEKKIEKKIDNFYSLSQGKIAELLCRCFYGVNIKDGAIEEIDFSHKTIAKKFSNMQNTETGARRLKRFREKINVLVKELESIMSGKETDKQLIIRSKREKSN